MTKQANSDIQINNNKVIITRWDFSPNDETGWHKHGYDYIVVPITDGKLTLETTEDQETVELQAGQTYFRPKGVEHNVINANPFDFSFVEIELKAST